MVQLFTFDSDPYNLVLSFENNTDDPFPIGLPPWGKIFISAIFLCSILFGLKYRLIMVQYLLKPDKKFTPINYFIAVNQLNGIMALTVMIFLMLKLIFPYPFSSIFGTSFCQWVHAPASIYILGLGVWSFTIALYRVVFIYCQTWVKAFMGEALFFRSVFCAEIVMWVGLSTLVVIVEQFNTFGRICLHYSQSDLEIFSDYQVGPFYSYKIK